MKILVANIGSTSFKFCLFSMPEERILAKGGIERIGSAEAPFQFQAGSEPLRKSVQPVADYAAALRLAFSALTGEGGLLSSLEELSAIGFKPIIAKGYSGTQELTEEVLSAMEAFQTLAPAHNPPYIQAVRLIRREFPGMPLIGTFETAFYDAIPEAACLFAVPQEWRLRYGIRRYGYHGASHRFVTERAAVLLDNPGARLISCHLGGSSSIAAVRAGTAVESSWAMTPQSGLPHNNRVGDLDAFALIYLLKDCGLSLAEVERTLMKESGLKGIAGTSSGDLRDILTAIDAGSLEARQALELLVKSIRKYIGQFLVELNGADGIIFTGGIGENSPLVRSLVCADLDQLGILLDPAANETALRREADISAAGSRVRLLTIPTSEETVIAREAFRFLQKPKERNI
jgi:acetate kinase